MKGGIHIMDTIKNEDKKLICKSCKGEMEKGFVGAKTNNGEESREDWGTSISFLGTGLNNSIPVTTFRCKNCGFLQSYAI